MTPPATPASPEKPPREPKPLTVPELRGRKVGAPGGPGEQAGRIAMITAYDYPMALMADRAGADMLLVGDSLAMVVLGLPDTLSLTVEEMLHHVKPVARAAKRALVVADMPFGSYQIDPAEAVANAHRFVAEGGARAVKVEGANHLAAVDGMVKAGIPVMGHIGLTPQSVAVMGGFKVQGKTASAAQKLKDEARALEDAGCFSMVLEGLPSPVAAAITRHVHVPTIGIGAGPDCDGQVLVIHDVLGLFERFTPRFVKRYAELAPAVHEALSAYVREVREGGFPGPEHCFAMAPEELDKLL